MGYRELTDALLSAGDEKVRQLRQATEAEADHIRGEAAAGIKKLQDDYRRRQESATAAETGIILAKAEWQAALIKLEAEKVLTGRLYTLAHDNLARLRDARYAELFAALVEELLPCQWQTVRVNPADSELTKASFPGAAIETDSAITGGMEVIAEGGRVRVDNTLDKRLERAWPELLPRLLNAVPRV
jgi:V/A-type H+-transporting ATPase subunit E